jgi:hypothetical protein
VGAADRVGAAGAVEGQEDRVGDPLHGVEATAQRRGRGRVDHAAGGRHEADRAVATLVLQDLGRDHVAHGAESRGLDRGRGAVERAADLRARAGVVDGHVAVVQRDRNPDADRVIGQAVAIEEALGDVGAVRVEAEVLAHHALGLVEAGGDDRGEGAGVEGIDQLQDTTLAHRDGHHLGADVAEGLVGHADVAGDQLQDLIDHAPRLMSSIGGIIRPSSNTSRASVATLPGERPPTSRWWPRGPAIATTVPSANTGLKIMMSVWWVPPR